MIKLLITIIIAAILITAAGCTNEPSKPVDAINSEKAPEIVSVEAFGIVGVTSSKNINIDFPASVAAINIKEGQRVKAGDVLATLDLEEYESRIRTMEIDLVTAENEQIRIASDLKAKQDYLYNNTDPDIKKYFNDKKTAESLFDKAKLELKAKESLHNAGALSLEELDDYKTFVDAKEKAIVDIAYSIDSLKYNRQKEIDTLKSDIEQKSAQAQSIKSELSLMRARLNKSYIKGNTIVCDVPNGIVFEIGYMQGDMISSEKKLLSIMDIDTMVVDADVSEEFIRDVKTGAEVTIIPQADKSKKYKGRILRIADKAVPRNSETVIPVEISIEDRDDFLLPGFNVDVEINIDGASQ